MFKFPLVILYAIVAFNISAFTVILQANLLIIHSPVEKIIAWAFTIAAWTLAYLNRNKFYEINLTGKLPENNMHHQ
jgi:hypothetical protein